MTCYISHRPISNIPQLKILCDNILHGSKIYNYKSFDNFDNNESKKLDNNLPPVSLSMISAMKYEACRLKSFEKGWTVPFIKPEDCASVGLFYLNEGDKVQCAFCNVILSNWEEGDKPVVEHVKHYPMCPYLMRQDVGNVPISGQNGLQQWQIRNARPERSPMQFAFQSRLSPTNVQTKHPGMSCFDKRLQTFQTWPSDQSMAKITPNNLAEAGLFYSGASDIVTCFCCGGQMGSWSSTDDPWIEHAKHFPCCPFVKSIKGTVFIEQARLGNLSENAATNDIEERSVLSAASSSQESPKENLANMCKKLETIEVTENGESGNSENKFLCKICMELRTRVAFIPCGHSLACPSCARELRTCPLCRRPIQSAVRLFFD